MNRSSHRLIYNAPRRCMMAVADTARSTGKSNGATRRKRCQKISANVSVIAENDRISVGTVFDGKNRSGPTNLYSLAKWMIGVSSWADDGQARSPT